MAKVIQRVKSKTGIQPRACLTPVLSLLLQLIPSLYATATPSSWCCFSSAFTITLLLKTKHKNKRGPPPGFSRMLTVCPTLPNRPSFPCTSDSFLTVLQTYYIAYFCTIQGSKHIILLILVLSMVFLYHKGYFLKN